MFSHRSLLSPWICIILLAGVTNAGNSTMKQPINETMKQPINETMKQPINETMKQPGNFTIKQPTNETSNETQIVAPSYVVRGKMEQPCLLATFNLTIKLTYYVKTNKSKHEYLISKNVSVPSDAEISKEDVCRKNKTYLILSWENTYNLNLTFVRHAENRKAKHSNWTLDSIVFGYNLSNHQQFPNSVKDKYVNVSKNGLQLFNTMIGHTKECRRQVIVKLGKDQKNPEFIFDYVRFAAFNLTSEEFPDEVEQCILKSSHGREEDIVVPLIIACSLSLVIVIVVIAYAISRKVQEARDQTQYKPMP